MARAAATKRKLKRAARKAAPARRRGRPAASFSARSEILLGAAEAFGAKGYADASVQDVLKAAKISRRTFYRFFRSKENLLEELADAGSMLFLQNVRTAASLGKTPEEKLSNCVEVYLRAPQNSGPIFHVLLAETSRPGSPLAPKRQAVITALIAMLREGVRDHQHRDVDPLVFRGLVAAMESISRYVFTETEGSEQDIQRAKAVMIQMVGAVLHVPEEAPASSASQG